MMMKSELVGVTEARDRFKELLEDCPERDVVILRHNRPLAVLVAPERLERLIERIEDLEDYAATLEDKLFPETLSHDDARTEILGDARPAS